MGTWGGMVGDRVRLGAVLVFFLATANALDLSALRRELKAEVEEGIGNDYNDDDLNEDNLLDALRDEAEPHAPYSSEEIESLEGSDEEEEGELPPGVPDIPGLTVDHGVLKDKGEKVFEDEDEIENESEDEDEIVDVQSIENIAEVKKLAPIKSISEIKSILPVKSIKEIANIEEVKEILPIPEDIARNFIAKHKLKHGRKHTISGENELPPDIHEDQPQAGVDKASYFEEGDFVNDMERQLGVVQKEVQIAMNLLASYKEGTTSNTEESVEEQDLPIGEGEPGLPQGGSADQEENEESDENSSEEIASIQPL